METIFIKSLKDSIKHWYIPLIVGVFFVIVSVVAFTSPASSLLALSFLFALTFVIGGLSEIGFSIANRHHLENWGWTLALGIITFVIGISLTIHPALSISVLAFYIGFLILFRSISAVSFALDIKKYGGKNWIGLMVLGILGAIFSFVLIWNPLLAGMSMVVLIALSFLFGGLFSIVLAFQLKRLHKSSKQLSAGLRKRFEELSRDIDQEWKA